MGIFHKADMKLFGSFALVAAVYGDTVSRLNRVSSSISTKYTEFNTYKQSKVDAGYLEKLDQTLQADHVSHNRVKGVRGIKLMPDGGECGLHWSLCPNMCNLDETLDNYFTEIRGNKMEKYQQWKTETALKKRAILKDLEGKLDQVEGLEEALRKNGLDLERREDLFITLLEDHIAKAIAIQESLMELKGDFDEIGKDLLGLGNKVDAAHTDCYDQAPCMAVPQCKLGVASGATCAEIAANAMDLDEQGEATLNLESGIHIIKPAKNLDAVAAICEFDYKGTGFTVVQNRYNDTGSFSGDFDGGFGTTVGYDDAECKPANYYLGNDYIREIAKNAGSVKVQHASGFDQWNSVSVRGDKLNLGNAQHLCGDTLDASDVRLGPGGINGRFQGQTQILIGNDMTPDMDVACIGGEDVYDGSATYDYKDSSYDY